jgi:hypothetical protein
LGNLPTPVYWNATWDKFAMSIHFEMTCDFILGLQDVAAWTQLLDKAMQWLCAGSQAADTEAIDNTALEESLQDMMEYSNEFSKLTNAQLPGTPVCPEVQDASVFLGKCLGQLSQKHPGKLQPILASLPPASQAKLNELVVAGGIPLC